MYLWFGTKQKALGGRREGQKLGVQPLGEQYNNVQGEME